MKRLDQNDIIYFITILYRHILSIETLKFWAKFGYQEALRLLDAQTALDHEAQEKGRAGIYHQLGIVAQEQRQWAQAEQYYQQALDLYVEFNARYSQARTYHQLGIVAQEQRQWKQARDLFLKVLEITTEFDDEDGLAITLRSLARLWQESADSSLPAAMASMLQSTSEEIETLLSSLLDSDAS